MAPTTGPSFPISPASKYNLINENKTHLEAFHTFKCCSTNVETTWQNFRDQQCKDRGDAKEWFIIQTDSILRRNQNSHFPLPPTQEKVIVLEAEETIFITSLINL